MCLFHLQATQRGGARWHLWPAADIHWLHCLQGDVPGVQNCELSAFFTRRSNATDSLSFWTMQLSAPAPGSLLSQLRLMGVNATTSGHMHVNARLMPNKRHKINIFNYILHLVQQSVLLFNPTYSMSFHFSSVTYAIHLLPQDNLTAKRSICSDCQRTPWAQPPALSLFRPHSLWDTLIL